jgi:integrase
MSSVYRPKGRTIWWMEFKDQHGVTRTNVSTGMKDRRAAEGLAHIVERDAERILAGQVPLEPTLSAPYLGLVLPGSHTWAHFRKRFTAEHLSGLRQSTRDKYDCVFDVFEQEMKPKNLKDIQEHALSNFAAALRKRVCPGTKKVGLAPWSIRNYLVAMKKALGWAVEQKLIPALPAFPEIKVPKKKPQPISEADWDKLFAQAPNDQWRAFLLCGWLGGLRLSEAWKMRRTRSEEWPWLDLAGNRVVLPAKFAKSDEDQWIPLHPRLRAALEALPDEGDELFAFKSRSQWTQLRGMPLTKTGVTNYVIWLASKAGVKLSMHRLRKGFGCRVAKQLGKGNAPILHQLMRHSSMQITTDFYANVDDVLQDAINQLDAPKPTPSSLPNTFPNRQEKQPESPNGESP